MAIRDPKRLDLMIDIKLIRRCQCTDILLGFVISQPVFQSNDSKFTTVLVRDLEIIIVLRSKLQLYSRQNHSTVVPRLVPLLGPHYDLSAWKKEWKAVMGCAGGRPTNFFNSNLVLT